MEKQPYSGVQKRRRLTPSVQTALVWLLIIAYIVYFSVYASQRHMALQTYAADLSYFDQPMWNTLHGRFMERTLGDRQVPRMTDHFEPILVPLSALYLLWDDARVILVLQCVVLAMGALPVYWIARRALSRVWPPDEQKPGYPTSRTAEWLALAFALVYLLFPAQQAANLADFHADPLLVTPLLFAFWYASLRRFWMMWFWAILALAVKENLPTVTFMLGLFLVLSDRRWWKAIRSRQDQPSEAVVRRPWVHGLALMVVSLAWLLIAMFLIVGPAARQFYGTTGPVYLFSRFGEPGSGGVAGQLGALVTRVCEPARLIYLAGLFASVGWLALLAPEYLLLGLPVLVANMVSVYPGQYSGEQHYSAPLVPAFMVAAIYGTQRLGSWANRRLLARNPPSGTRDSAPQQTWNLAPQQTRNLAPQQTRDSAPRFGSAALAAGIGAWLLAWSIGYQVRDGWTPVGRNFAWPQVTAHERLLERFVRQIPTDAAVSTTPPLHPHLAHRQTIYQFPIVSEDTDYVLVDVSGVTDMHPNDVRGAVMQLLDSGQFGVSDAADGYLLLSRQAAGREQSEKLPDAFYDFARAGDKRPQYPLDIRFGDSLQLLGYDIEDDPKWRQTRYRFYWQALTPPSNDTAIAIQMLTPWGAAADDTARRPMPALLWYPPERWRTGEVIVTETVPWYLPRAWAPVIEVSAEEAKLRPSVQGSGVGVVVDPTGERVRLQAQERREGRVVSLDDPPNGIEATSATFAANDWTPTLTGYNAPARAAPGSELPVTLRWRAGGPSLGQTDYTVFLHLRDASKGTVANGDGTPTWFIPLPTWSWSQSGGEVWDAHGLSLPPELSPGRYDLVVGWYDWRTGQRLPSAPTEGNAARDEFVLGSVTIDPRAAPVPDLCCLYAQECCASQESSISALPHCPALRGDQS